MFREAAQAKSNLDKTRLSGHKRIVLIFEAAEWLRGECFPDPQSNCALPCNDHYEQYVIRPVMSVLGINFPVGLLTQLRLVIG